jgi:RNA polymerase sigma factor (sigma-70 family)
MSAVAADPPPLLTPHELLARCRPYLIAVSSRRAGRYGLNVDDLYHEAAAVVLRTAHRFRPDRGMSPVGFAYWAAKQAFRRKYVRRWLRQWSIGVGAEGWNRADRQASGRHDPADAAELADDLAAVRRGLTSLTPGQRAAVELRFGLRDGSPVAGVALAAALGISDSSANDRLRGALRKLAGFVGADTAVGRLDRAEGITLGKLKGRPPEQGRQPRRSARKRRKRKPATPAAVEVAPGAPPGAAA